MVLKNPADFIGSVLGESEKNTKAILAATVGKVLVIDEVNNIYRMCAGTNGLLRRIPCTEEADRVAGALAIRTRPQ